MYTWSLVVVVCAPCVAAVSADGLHTNIVHPDCLFGVN